MKKVKLRILTTAILFCLGPVGVFAGLTNFQMFWGFTNSTGTNGTWSRNDICVGGTIYVRNLSNYNGNVPIPNTLTGTYKIYNAVGTSNGVLIGTIPASSWPYNGVYAFNVPANSIFNYSSGLNIRIYYSGSDVSTGDRDNMCYLTTRALPSVNSGADQSICRGGSVFLTGSGAGTYTWNPGGVDQSSIMVSPTISTTYTLSGSIVYSNTSSASMTQSLACSNSDAVNITVLPNPTVKGWSRNHFLCTGAAFPTLNAYAGIGSYSYQWSYAPDGGSYSVLSSTSTNLFTGSYGFGYYQVLVTNNSTGCSTTLTTHVSLDSSAALFLNSSFNSTENQNQINNTVQILTSPNGMGNHVWEVFNSDVNQNQGSLIANYTTTNINITLPLTGYYLVKHTISQAPCNEPVSTAVWYAYDILRRVSTKQTISNDMLNRKSSFEQLRGNIEDFTFNIYPNPTNGKFNIDFEESSVQQITVTDALGKIVLENKTDANSTNACLDLSEYPSGVYFIKINAGEKTIMKKIVKD